MNKQIKEHIKNGYTIVSESKDYITLKVPDHKFSVGYCILWTIFTGGFGLIGYIAYHFIKSNGRITLEKR